MKGAIGTKIGQVRALKQKTKELTADLKTLPGDKLIQYFSNELKKRQAMAIKGGNPITEEEMIAGLKSDWRVSKHIYTKAGITFEKLVEAGKEALSNPGDYEELPGPVQKIVSIVSRKQKCPCGSGKKYKRCCGKT